MLTGWPNHPKGKLFPGYKRKCCGNEVDNGVPVQRIWHFLPGNKSARKRIAYWLSFSLSSFLAVLFGPKVDLVYSNTVPLTGPLALCLAARLRRARYVYGIFDIYPEAALEAKAIRDGLLFRMALKMDTWVCRHAARIRVIGQRQKETLVQRGISEGKIGIVPLWLEASRVQPQGRAANWREENHIDADALVILYAGTIGLISGGGLVLDVASRVKSQSRILFLFVGEGALKRELQARATEQGLENVRFLPFQPEDRLSEVFHSADIGLVTLLPGAGKNSVPSKVLGYLAAGLPVLASVDADCDIARYIRAGHCGRVCASQDAVGFQVAVEELLDFETRVETGRAARKLFEDRFSRASGTAQCTRLLLESVS